MSHSNLYSWTCICSWFLKPHDIQSCTQVNSCLCSMQGVWPPADLLNILKLIDLLHSMFPSQPIYMESHPTAASTSPMVAKHVAVAAALQDWVPLSCELDCPDLQPPVGIEAWKPSWAFKELFRYPQIPLHILICLYSVKDVIYIYI